MKGVLERLEKGVIVTDERGYICYCNTRILCELETRQEVIEGQVIQTILDGEITNVVHEQKCTAYLRKNGGARQAVQLEVLQEDWEGHEAYYYLIENTSADLLENIRDDERSRNDQGTGQSMYEDVSKDKHDRKYKLDEIKKEVKEKLELQRFLETAVDLTAIIDDKHKIWKINKGWQTQLGWEPKEVLGQSIKKFTHPNEKHKLVNVIKEKRISNGFTIRIRCKDGSYKYFEWNINYIEDKKIAICTARDISERKAHEREKEAYKQKIAIEKIRNEFFSNVSHEFRTPINIILASLQLIEGKLIMGEPVEEDQLKKYMKKIRQNTYRLLKLSNNLIDLTKMDIGCEPLRLSNHNIISIIEEITLSVVTYAEGNGIELIFDTEVEELIMACDVEKIERIVLNLLSNAVKFTPRGGKIEVNVFKRPKTIMITVKDTGIGIPKEKCSLIFERCTQVDTSLRRRHEGTGMGLAIVKSILDMYHGEISVSSVVGEGTNFTVTLPRHIVEKQGVEENPKQTTALKVERGMVEFSDIYGY